MPEHITHILLAAGIAEIVFILVGFAVWWRAALRPAMRIAPWQVSFSDFLACALAVVGGGFFFQFLIQAATSTLLHKFSASADTRTIVYSAAFQFGLLAGVFCARIYLRARPENITTSPPRQAGPPPLAGLLTFFAVLPVVMLASFAWSQTIRLLGLPPEPQELVDMFAHPRSRASFAALFILATIVAPVVEELVFRAGLFRYLRTRIPRWAALLLPALLFAALHGNWASLGPIAALAIVFSLAYERTGDIRVTMIAHGLFNLNTILLILAGMPA